MFLLGVEHQRQLECKPHLIQLFNRVSIIRCEFRPLTSTLANKPQTTRIQSQVKLNELKPISELIPQLNPAFPTLRPVQTSETTIRPSMLVTRPKISRVNVFPGGKLYNPNIKQ